MPELYMTSFPPNLQGKHIIALLKSHTGDCLDFKGYTVSKAREGYDIIECTCGHIYTIERWVVGVNHVPWSKEVTEYVQASNMFSHTLRQRAIVNQTPLEEIISPILGMCLDRNEDIEWEAEYL
jgi:hypothetical protein